MYSAQGDAFIHRDARKKGIRLMKSSKSHGMPLRRAIALAAFALCALAASAMPTQKEMAEARPVVKKLMSPLLAKYNAKKISASEVADGALALFLKTDGSAERLMLMSGAVSYYAKGGDYEKAALAVEEVIFRFPDIPPAMLNKITSSAMAGVDVKAAPHLAALAKTASVMMAVTDRLAAVKKDLLAKPDDAALRRALAELTFVTNIHKAGSRDKKVMLNEFAKLGGKIGALAKALLDGTGKEADVEEFVDCMWTYKPVVSEVQDVIRALCSTIVAGLYREALDKGSLKGPKKEIAEKRLAEFAERNDPVMDVALQLLSQKAKADERR